MSQASILINVSTEDHSHANGLSGILTVPAKKPGEEFGLLVVYPTPEIQDIGDQRRTVHWLKSRPLAMDVAGMRSDSTAHTPGSAGGKLKWGVLLCEAEPDVPKELLQAQEKEMEFLNDNLPDTKTRKDKATGAIVLVNVETKEVADQKQELSDLVRVARSEFEDRCRKLVQKSEVQKAKHALATEDARLISEADTIWAGPEAGRGNINEIHKRACKRLGQNRPWCYIPQQLIPCPGCGAGILENILMCPHCQGFLDEGIEELRAMKPKDRAQKMYPERYAEPAATSGAPSGRQARA